MIALYIRTKTKYDKYINPNIIKQRTKLRRYALSRKEDFRYYIDEGCSGFDYNRKALSQLLTDCKYGIINEVVVVDNNKIGRDNLKLKEIISKIKEYGLVYTDLSIGEN